MKEEILREEKKEIRKGRDREENREKEVGIEKERIVCFMRRL